MKEGELPSHLVSMGRSGWLLWRWIWLRGAGFPASGILKIGSDAIFEIFEQERRALRRLEDCRSRALELCRAAMTEHGQTAELKKAHGRVKSRRRPVETGFDQVDAALGAYGEAREQWSHMGARVEAVIEDERRRIDGALREAGRDPLFREALCWQNRSVLHNAVDTYLNSEPGTDNFKTRERQRLIAKYFQRYSVKNETIGFFGPSAWGEFDSRRQEFVTELGPTLFDKRRVSFESWAVDSIAAYISDRLPVHPIYEPRKKPFSWLSKNTVHVPPGKPRQLSDTDAWLFARCDGRRFAREIAELAAREPSVDLASVEQAYEALRRLAKQGLISWTIEIPADLGHPQEWLRERLLRLDDEQVRRAALEPLDRLEAARAHVAAQAGKPEALYQAIEALEREFHDITAMAVKRGHGQAYAGRQLFYEDCTRSVDLTIGRRFLDGIDEPMGLVLASARWFTYQVARQFRVISGDIYQQLVKRDGQAEVPLGVMLVALRGTLTEASTISPFVEEIRHDLQSRWKQALGLDDHDLDQPVLSFKSADCRAAVSSLFDAPAPGWPRARYHAPDMMIAAASPEEISRGNFLAVLGELHCGTNTLLARAAYRLHPDQEPVKEAWDRDMGMVCIAPVQASASRSTHLPVSDTDLHFEINWARSWRPRDHVIEGGDLFIVRDGDRLVVRSRTQPLEYDIVAFMEHYLCAAVAPHFSILPGRKHLPRVVVDNLVISRERWKLARTDFDGLLEKASLPELVRRVNAWAHELRLPRLLFVKVPGEKKPFYLDLTSPPLIDVFVRHLQDADSLGLSEMLPSHEDLWLRDASGNVYTSELRVAVVDPIHWRPEV